MVTYFTEEDLVTFGQYLLSDIRKNAIKEISKTDEEFTLKFKEVYEADIENWHQINKEKVVIKDGN